MPNSRSCISGFLLHKGCISNATPPEWDASSSQGTPGSTSLVPIYTAGWRETKWRKISVEEKNATSRLQLGPPVIKFEVSTAQPPCLLLTNQIEVYFLQSKPFVNIISFLHATLHYMLRNSMHESLYHNRVFRLNTAWFLETIRIHSLSQCHPAFWMEHIGRHVRVLNSQYFWVKMSQVQQSSISTWEAIWAQWVFYHFQRICIGHTVS